MADLFCQQSTQILPIGKLKVRTWIYVCDFDCPEESIVANPRIGSIYCVSMENFYKNVRVVLQHGEPVSFNRDYFIVLLPRGNEGHVAECITQRTNCSENYWLLVVRTSKDYIVLSATDPRQVEELFNIKLEKKVASARGIDVVTHAIIEAVKDMETLINDGLIMLDYGKYKNRTLGRALGGYTALTEALAQIASSCLTFGSDFMRQNLRYMACGRFVPIPRLYDIFTNIRECERARDWNCLATWTAELQKLIDTYRHPTSSYAQPEEEKDIFQSQGPLI